MLTSAVTIIREDEVDPEVWLFESAEAAKAFALGIGALPVNLLIEVHTPDLVLDASHVSDAIATFASSIDGKWTCEGMAGSAAE